MSAVSSALSGIASAQAMFDTAAQAGARVGASGGDPTDAIVGTRVASDAVAVNVAVLGKALDLERSLVNILA